MGAGASSACPCGLNAESQSRRDWLRADCCSNHTQATRLELDAFRDEVYELLKIGMLPVDDEPVALTIEFRDTGQFVKVDQPDGEESGQVSRPPLEFASVNKDDFLRISAILVFVNPFFANLLDLQQVVVPKIKRRVRGSHIHSGLVFPHVVCGANPDLSQA